MNFMRASPADWRGVQYAKGGTKTLFDGEVRQVVVERAALLLELVGERRAIRLKLLDRRLLLVQLREQTLIVLTARGGRHGLHVLANAVLLRGDFGDLRRSCVDLRLGRRCRLSQIERSGQCVANPL